MWAGPDERMKEDERTDGDFKQRKLEYKQTEKQVDFFSDTKMFVG